MSVATQITGMGAMPHAGGVAFRVWAPNAQRVSVIGSFNDWDGDTHPMYAEEHGSWYADVVEAQIGDQYRFLLTTAQGACTRIDPYAREVTTSVGNAIVHDPHFDWEGDDLHLAPRKRSTLAAAMVFTAPGIPMLFQGQEFLEGEWFRDTVPLDWDHRDEFHGIVRLYRDLMRLRRNRDGCTRGLCGQFTQVYHVHDARKVLAYHRWDKGGAGDDVVVVANFLNEPQEGYVIGFPAAGTWTLRFNSDWQGYSEDFAGYPSPNVITAPGAYDGCPCHAALSIGPYSVLIFSQ